jgi:ABC-type Co2+ transport system permease subunit
MLVFVEPILAVHISDGYLNRPLDGLPWLVGGYAVMAALMFWGSRRIRDDEIPRIALLTAAFTVASALHVSIGPASVHLILNGLVGAVLGRRAALAIPVGLFLQAVAGHGGFTTLGINSCVMMTPALLAGLVVRSPTIRECCGLPALQLGVSALLWTFGVVFGIALLVSRAWNYDTPEALFDWSKPWIVTALGAGTVVALAAVTIERRLRPSPEVVLGYLVGQLAVLMSVCLSAVVMLLGGPANKGAFLFALIFFVAHLPLAVVEGFVVGFMLGYLARVKPELLLAEPVAARIEAEETLPRPVAHAQPRSVEQCPADTAT